MSETLEAPAAPEDALHQQRIAENEAAQAEVPPGSQEAPPPAPEPTAEENAAQEAAATQKAEAEKAKSRTDKRITTLTAQKRAAEARIAELEKLVPKPAARDPNVQMTPEELEAELDRRANDRVKAQEQTRKEQAFVAECNKIASAGAKEFGDDEADGFQATLSNLWDTLGGFDSGLVEAALETGDAHRVLYKLAQDSDEAERIAGLSPARRAAALAKMAVVSKVNPLNPTPAPPPQSKAPDPIRPLQRGGGNAEPRLAAESQEEFEKAYRLELKKRRG